MTTDIRVIKAQRGLRENIRIFLNYRELIVSWTLREIRGRYRQSALGFGWALITPIVQMVVISIIFGGFLGVPSEGVPYPVFTFVAILPWSLFSGAIIGAVPSVLTNMGLITKIYFPREILPFSAVLARVIDFAVSSLVFLGLMIYFDMPFYTTWFFVPVLVIIQLALSLGLGLFGAAISVYLRDISFAIPLLMQLWMYATPVIYPISMVPESILPLYRLNPMVGIIESYRMVILDGTLPGWSTLGYPAVISVVTLMLSFVYFKRLEMMMADIV